MSASQRWVPFTRDQSAGLCRRDQRFWKNCTRLLAEIPNFRRKASLCPQPSDVESQQTNSLPQQSWNSTDHDSWLGERCGEKPVLPEAQRALDQAPLSTEHSEHSEHQWAQGTTQGEIGQELVWENIQGCSNKAIKGRSISKSLFAW